MDRLEDRAAIEDQMFRYARATDWMETENHRLVFADETPGGGATIGFTLPGPDPVDPTPTGRGR